MDTPADDKMPSTVASPVYALTDSDTAVVEATTYAQRHGLTKAFMQSVETKLPSDRTGKAFGYLFLSAFRIDKTRRR